MLCADNTLKHHCAIFYEKKSVCRKRGMQCPATTAVYRKWGNSENYLTMMDSKLFSSSLCQWSTVMSTTEMCASYWSKYGSMGLEDGAERKILTKTEALTPHHISPFSLISITGYKNLQPKSTESTNWQKPACDFPSLPKNISNSKETRLRI